MLSVNLEALGDFYLNILICYQLCSVFVCSPEAGTDENVPVYTSKMPQLAAVPQYQLEEPPK